MAPNTAPAGDKCVAWRRGGSLHCLPSALFFIMTIYDYLGITKNELLNIDVPRNYITYRIKKNNGNGVRRIDAPMSGLKRIQNIILHKILYEFKPHDIAHGFVKGKSPRTNASPHVGKKYIIKIDLENFFGSIHWGSILSTIKYLCGVLSKKGLFDEPSKEDQQLIADILSLNGSVPQGAPSSPALTNLCCYWLDSELEKINKLNNTIQITRYADDITISLDEKERIGPLIGLVTQLLRQKRLRANRRKLRVCSYSTRQKITGVVVNTKLNTSKESWRNLRAALHNAKKTPISEKTMQQLRGQIEWLRSLNPVRGKQFLDQLGEIAVLKP